MYDDLISVIVPVYNAEEYLKECIDSILNQTYKNIELILINDGSTDNSGLICKEYAKRDSRVVYIEQKNGGAAIARNSGLDICSGDYIGFVDSDDKIDLDMYELLLSAIKENDADVSQILSRRFTNDGIILNEELIKKTESMSSEIFDSDEAIKRYLLGNHSLCTHLYSFKLFDNVRMPENMSGEDLAIIIPLYSKCKKVVKLNKYKYNYRFNIDSVTNTPLNQRKINLFFEFENQLEKYYDNEFYKNILIFEISKTLSGILNSMILMGNNSFSHNEKFFNQKLKSYIKDFECNKFISSNQIKKYKLYLSNRFIYRLMLKIKRAFYKKPLYGQE